MNFRLRTSLLPAALIVLALASLFSALRGARDEERFPHAEHARLFPVCEGCHEGVPAGDSANFYPDRALCARCHDGTQQPAVVWERPAPRPDNIEFSHVVHAVEASDAGDVIECSSCHMPEGAERMALQHRTEPDRCFDCHAHAATDHFVDAPCAQCHVQLADTRLPLAQIASFPAPETHSRPGFLEKLHGELSRTDPERCVVCHTRETCTSCHVDAGSRTEIASIPAANPQLDVPPTRARYFTPPSHEDPEWLEKHGGRAQANIASCGSCHTRETCEACHAQEAPRAIAALPRGAAVAAPGVAVSLAPPRSHQTPFFDREHGALAAARPRSCAGCHTRVTCESCHTANATVGAGASNPDPAPRSDRVSGPAGAAAGRYVHLVSLTDTTRKRPPARADRRANDYHPRNFMERHASASYGRNLDCQSCHETATFCRSCHEQAGMRAVGRLGAGFHDAQPNWLLNHGRPARQGLESCASCHRQRDCMQCHSETGAFRVNPHGPGFDARRMIALNPRVCYACHLSDPTRGRNP